MYILEHEIQINNRGLLELYAISTFTGGVLEQKLQINKELS